MENCNNSTVIINHNDINKRQSSNELTKKERKAIKNEQRAVRKEEIRKTLVHYTVGEEIFNSVTHGVGVLLGIAATVLLVVKAALTHAGAKAITAVAIYGASIIILYLMSTLYHALSNPFAKKVFRVFDHTTIFILIAGTYTPYSLVMFDGKLGWWVFGVQWGCAILGIILNAISIEKFKVFSIILYVVLGWMIVFAGKALITNLALPGIVLLITGGIAYTLGIIFYKLKKIKYMHSIWHLWVLAGSVLHFFSIFCYVL